MPYSSPLRPAEELRRSALDGIFRPIGTDTAKKIVGRKRSIVTDTLGLLLAVLVTAASIQDSTAGTHMAEQVAAAHPTIRQIWVDGVDAHVIRLWRGSCLRREALPVRVEVGDRAPRGAVIRMRV